MSNTDPKDSYPKEGFPYRSKGFRCFECNAAAEHAHHVVPYSLGGTRTIPLCTVCHGKVHDRGFSPSAGNLIKLGLERRKARGGALGRPVKIRIEEVTALLNAGNTVKQVAQRLAVGVSSVYEVLRKHR